MLATSWSHSKRQGCVANVRPNVNNVAPRGEQLAIFRIMVALQNVADLHGYFLKIKWLWTWWSRVTQSWRNILGAIVSPFEPTNLSKYFSNLATYNVQQYKYHISVPYPMGPLLHWWHLKTVQLDHILRLFQHTNVFQLLYIIMHDLLTVHLRWI